LLFEGPPGVVASLTFAAAVNAEAPLAAAYIFTVDKVILDVRVSDGTASGIYRVHLFGVTVRVRLVAELVSTTHALAVVPSIRADRAILVNRSVDTTGSDHVCCVAPPGPAALGAVITALARR
jgi:hypothetical protein